MIILPQGYEIVKEKKPTFKGTFEKALSDGFERAMKVKGVECDYEFTIETKKGVKYILCEIRVDNGYITGYKHKESEKLDLSEIERNAYQFLMERL